jgi:acyl-CoA synthetase (AMP-forming)/AMP-acid ligase II
MISRWEAAAFGVPDSKYGEEVEAVPRGSAGVLPGAASDFKVPKVIRIVSELPKNAMGKVKRRALATLYPLAS